MDITDKEYFDDFHREIGFEIQSLYEKYDFSDANGDLSFKTVASAVFSSNISGNTVDLNTFMKQRLSKKKPK